MGSHGARHGKVTVGGKAASRNGFTPRPNRKAVIGETVREEYENPPRRSRKNTRRWCKGKPGVEHQAGLRMSTYGWWLSRKDICGMGAEYRRGRFTGQVWRCFHQEVCEICGRVLRKAIPPQQCPDYQEGKPWEEST